ncbi:MAG TPA: response regulator transcription factor [Gammaproteobacteria bacterium]
MNKRPIRIYLVDRHAMLRQGLAQMLMLDPRVTVVGQSPRGLDCVRELPAKYPDIVLFDLKLEDMDGCALCQRILALRPATRMLALTDHEDQPSVSRAMGAGAKGYLVKSDPPEQALHAILRVHAGGFHLSEAARRALIGRVIRDDPERDQLDTLTPREVEVFILIVQGVRTKDIAARLGVTSSTITALRARILLKLGLTTTGEIIRFGIRNGIDGG